ncbi:MAG: hypothetical protein CGW95_04795 [Phenylobacterium zucineum]|nr:MAG: hypothetical protein CGW95_04795 [Phenylobacterium zucineum]
MAKTKFSLAAKPTFTAKVAIPVPGEGTADVEFTFKGRTREQLLSMLESEGKTWVDVVMDMASGWELVEPFDAEHVQQLLDNYLGAFQAIQNTYLKELTAARLGN